MPVLERLHVEAAGTGNPLLLFVPGWGCDQTVWSLLTPLLEGRFRVATFDPRGFGKSEEALTEPSGWSLSVTCEDITAVLGALAAPPVVGEYTKSRVPQSKLAIVEGTGHLPHLTAPAAVAHEITDFAAGL